VRAGQNSMQFAVPVRTPVPSRLVCRPLYETDSKVLHLVEHGPATSSGMKTLVINAPGGATGHIGGAVGFAIRVQEFKTAAKAISGRKSGEF